MGGRISRRGGTRGEEEEGVYAVCGCGVGGERGGGGGKARGGEVEGGGGGGGRGGIDLLGVVDFFCFAKAEVSFISFTYCDLLFFSFFFSLCFEICI